MAVEDTEETEGTQEEETQETEHSEKEVDWKSQSRKWEREAKKHRKTTQEMETRLKEREESDQTDQERAIATAREEGEKTARESAEKERRVDRLENATLKLAGRGITVKDGDDTKSLKFADPDDAFTYVDRLLRRGDLDEDELFDDKGRVNNEVLTTALEELLAAKPHLSASSSAGNSKRVAGTADAGKGSGGGKDLEELSPDEHFARIRKYK